MKLVVVIPSILIPIIFLTGCYTHCELPRHIPTKKLNKESERLINFTYAVIDTFDNDWLSDEGYYYEYRPRSNRRIKEEKIDLFLNMLYAKGYNIVGAWCRPAIYECSDYIGPIINQNNTGILSPVFIILLSDVDDSIIEYDFYALTNKPEIVCPYNVEEYWVEEKI